MSNPLFLEAIDRLQDAHRQHRIRWESFFQDSDRHRNKRISTHAMRRGLKASNVELSNGMVEAIVEEYKTSDGKVNYQKLCQEIESAFTIKDLEKNPTYELSASASTLPNNRHYNTFNNGVLCQEDQTALSRLLSNLRRKVANEGTIVKHFFKDFDRHNIGFVSREQFQRGAKAMFPVSILSAQDTELLLRAYSDSRGDVNYRLFADQVDVSAPGGAGKSSFESKDELSRSVLMPKITFEDEQDFDATVATMQYTVFAQGIRLKTFFDDWDKMRKYKIAPGQFKSALNIALGKYVYMSNQMLAQLVAKYQTEDGLVDYMAFIDSIDVNATAVKGLYSQPRKEAKETRFVQHALNQFDSPELRCLLSNLRNSIANRRPNLKPVFEDFDRRHRAEVTRAQFKRVLAQELPQAVTTEEEMDLLCDAFRKGNTSMVDYLAFIDKVDNMFGNASNSARLAGNNGNVQQLSSAALAMLNNSLGGSYEDVVAKSHDQAMEKIRRIIKCNRIRLREFLADADALNHGLIKLDAFSQGLLRARVEMLPTEIELLVAPYIGRDKCLRWKALLQEIEKVECETNLHREPTKPGEPIELQELNPAYRMTEDEIRRTDYVLQSIRSEVANSRILLTPTFKLYDRLNHGKLSKSLFRRALDSVQIKTLNRCDEHTFQLLALRFCVPHSVDTVNYKKFIELVDSNINDTALLTGKALQENAQALRDAVVAQEKSVRGQVLIDELLVRLQDQSWSRRIRVKEFLADFDPLRKGVIPSSKFLSAIRMCGLSVTPAELACLELHYASKSAPGKIDYMPFIYALDGGDEKLEMNPTKEVRKMVGLAPSERNKRRISNQELEKVIAPMKREVQLRQILLKDQFQYFDRQHIKAVTVNQFASVLKMNRLLPADHENALNVLHLGYPAAHAEKIDYSKFIQDLEG